jgi:hypothetical protein
MIAMIIPKSSHKFSTPSHQPYDEPQIRNILPPLLKPQPQLMHQNHAIIALHCPDEFAAHLKADIIATSLVTRRRVMFRLAPSHIPFQSFHIIEQSACSICIQHPSSSSQHHLPSS